MTEKRYYTIALSPSTTGVLGNFDPNSYTHSRIVRTPTQIIDVWKRWNEEGRAIMIYIYEEVEP